MKIIHLGEDSIAFDISYSEIPEFASDIEEILKRFLPFEEVLEIYGELHNESSKTLDDEILLRLKLLHNIDFINVEYYQNKKTITSGYTLILNSDNDDFIQWLFELKLERGSI